MARYFYGFRYYSGRSTTWNNTRNIAGAIVKFKAKRLRDKWLDEEKRSAPCGCGGGERIAVNSQELRKLCKSMTLSEFKESLEYVTEIE